MKKLYIFVGPKGSGKSFVGTLVQDRLNIPFFRVEDFWISLNLDTTKPDYIKQGFIEVEKEIDRKLTASKSLSFESTAAFDYFHVFLERLRSKYDVKLIRIRAPLDLCLSRVKSRDQSIHIPVSDDRVNEINKIAEKVEIDFDLEINNADATADELIEQFSRIV